MSIHSAPAITRAHTSLEAIAKIQDYSATMVKRERIDGVLGEHQYLFVKVRHQPFSVYVYFLAPADLKGQESIYIAGTLWMRTARQKRVVAFRTFLRTLLHEIGHHVDYTRLRLGDSFHTQGFYQRESHLFHQLVTDGGQSMATPEEQMARMDRTADDLLSAIKGTPDHLLTKRPDDKNWSPIEVLCHLRDTEESFMARFQTIMVMDEPKFPPVEPDRWASERQYQRNDAREAIAAFRVRRDESLKFLRGLRPEQMARGGLHATRGRMTIADFVGLMAWHDDNHLDQLKRALAGKP